MTLGAILRPPRLSAAGSVLLDTAVEVDDGVSVEGAGATDASTVVDVDDFIVTEDADTTTIGFGLESLVEADGTEAALSTEQDAVTTAAASADLHWNRVHVADKPLAGNRMVWHSGTSEFSLNASCQYGAPYHKDHHDKVWTYHQAVAKAQSALPHCDDFAVEPKQVVTVKQLVLNDPSANTEQHPNGPPPLRYAQAWLVPQI